MKNKLFLEQNWLLLLSLMFVGCANAPTTNTELLQPSSVKEDISGRHLATIHEVKKWMEEEQEMLIFEISKKEKYAAGHLLGAFNIWRPDYENKHDFAYGGMIASKIQMEALLSKYGMTPDTKLVLYDTKGSVDAMRFRWILRLYGYDNMVVMNGGKVAWEKAGYQLVSTPTAATKSTKFTFPIHQNLPQVATLADVRAAIIDTNVLLVDTREKEEYLGQPYISKQQLWTHKEGAYTHGCIPTAIHFNWSDAVDLAQDHCIKSLKDLQYNMKMANISPDKEIITYCQSGVRSAHTSYILEEILGYPKVKNYDGSWIEWSFYHLQDEGVDIQQHTPKLEFDRLYGLLNSQLIDTSNGKAKTLPKR